MFGHPVLLSFNKKGNTHNTVIGGCISIFVLVILLAYFGIHFNTLINYGDDKISIKELSVNLIEADEVRYQDMKYINTFALMNGEIMAPVKYDDDAKKHVTIMFNQQQWDYAATPPVFPYRTKMGIRSCTEEDFNRTEVLKDRFI